MPRGLRAPSVCIPVPLVLSCALHYILFPISILHMSHLHAWLVLVRTLALHFNESPYYLDFSLLWYSLLSLPIAFGHLCFCPFVDSKPYSYLVMMFAHRLDVWGYLALFVLMV